MKKQKWLFVTDSWTTLDHSRDTSLRIMQAASSQGVEVFWSDSRSIRLEDNKGLTDAFRFRNTDLRIARESGVCRIKKAKSIEVSFFDQIHYRVDPPIDLHYLHPLQVLDQFASKKIINPAKLLALRSEKTLAAEVPLLFPRSIVSADQVKLLSFVRSKKAVILKPLHQAQSKGIKKLDSKEIKLTNECLKQATENYSRPVLLQEFLGSVKKNGETRLWFVNGQLIAWVQKHPQQGESVINMDQGGFLTEKMLSSRDRAQIKTIKTLLKRNKIVLAAVDLIEGKITDLNFTSPGLLVSMETVLKIDIATKVVKSLLKKSNI